MRDKLKNKRPCGSADQSDTFDWANSINNMVGEADTVSIILKRSQKEEKLHFRLQGRVAKLEELVSQGPRKNPAGFDFTFQSTITRGGRVE